MAAASVQAQGTGEFISGKGVTLVQNKCVLCHEAGHITKSRLSRDEWEENLKTMIARGMPPISDEETRVVLDYLSTYYGTKSAPPPEPDTFAAGPTGNAVSKAEKILGANACMGCHAVDQKIVGPAFKAVAAKYAGDKTVLEKLTKKIREGGQGVWGAVPMPANSQMSVADIDIVVK